MRHARTAAWAIANWAASSRRLMRTLLALRAPPLAMPGLPAMVGDKSSLGSNAALQALIGLGDDLGRLRQRPFLRLDGQAPIPRTRRTLMAKTHGGQQHYFCLAWATWCIATWAACTCPPCRARWCLSSLAASRLVAGSRQEAWSGCWRPLPLNHEVISPAQLWTRSPAWALVATTPAVACKRACCTKPPPAPAPRRGAGAAPGGPARCQPAAQPQATLRLGAKGRQASCACSRHLESTHRPRHCPRRTLCAAPPRPAPALLVCRPVLPPGYAPPARGCRLLIGRVGWAALRILAPPAPARCVKAAGIWPSTRHAGAKPARARQRALCTKPQRATACRAPPLPQRPMPAGAACPAWRGCFDFI